MRCCPFFYPLFLEFVRANFFVRYFVTPLLIKKDMDGVKSELFPDTFNAMSTLEKYR